MGVNPIRRTAMLTIAILQLVASRRGIAAMPGWAVMPYLEKGYVESRPVRKQGLYSNLHAATTRSLAQTAYMKEFITIMKRVSFDSLKRIAPVSGES